MAFGGYLKQSTAVDVLIGPFVDDTDGKTAETGLTLAQADIKLSKNGQTLAQKNDATSASHDSDGYYNCELDATDTGTLGTLVLIVHESGALPVRHEFQIVTANWYDSMCSTENLDVNVAEVSDDSTAADNLELFTEISNITSLTVDADGHIESNVVEIEGSDPTDQINAACDTALTDYDAVVPGDLPTNFGSMGIEADGHVHADVKEIEGSDATDQIRDSVVDDTTRIDASALNTLSGHDPGEALAGASDISGLNDPTAAAIADAVWDEVSAGHTDAGKAGAQLWTDIDAILADTNELQGDLTDGGRLDLLIDAILEDTGTTLDTLLDTLVARLTAARAGYLDNLGIGENVAGVSDISGLNNLSDTDVLSVIDTDSVRVGDILTDTNEIQGKLPAGSISDFDPTSDNVTVGTNSDKTGYSLSASGVDDVWDEVMEGALTGRHLMRIFLAVLANQSTGGGTGTQSYRDVGDTKNRVSCNTDANHNRTSSTLDGT